MNIQGKFLLAWVAVLGLGDISQATDIQKLDAIHLRIDRHFDPSLRLSIERMEDEIFLLRYVLISASGENDKIDPEAVKSKVIKKEDFQQIEDLIIKDEFWQEAITGAFEPKGLDGESWTLPGRKGRFQFGSSEWNPIKGGMVYQTGSALLDLAGVDSFGQ